MKDTILLMVKDPNTMETHGAQPQPHVDLTDPSVRDQWLIGVCAHAADLVCAALDATDPPAKRKLGRRGAREMVTEAADSLRVAFAAVGLDLASPPNPILFLLHAREVPGATRE